MLRRGVLGGHAEGWLSQIFGLLILKKVVIYFISINTPPPFLRIEIICLEF